ncbi:MAG: hypothetical protein ACK42D_01445 [Candidatus Paceibacteria bacterium]
MSARQAAELDHAFERNGWTPAEVKKLSQGNTLAQVRRVLLGHAEIIVPEYIIDCDASPFVPDGWSAEEHQPNGVFKWSLDNVALYLDKGQKDGKWIKGNQLRKELEDKPVLNANVLDYLLAHPHLIPEEWKGKVVFFWGTIYRRPLGRLCVRSLFWSGGRWRWYARWLGLGWDGDYPALLSRK